ncbi:sensor histidine kinase [Ideonella sp. B7]|uniref:sensor histidine kinase n=1 Tax=Ideonella benzenivorans TaxID=2831643 RepID=UPI001CEDAD17|nr:ATP-binding protein [Ideonella benzenivorans]MCA6217516.1 sensor histidine kinase [Ideonella benzenivorans]
MRRAAGWTAVGLVTLGLAIVLGTFAAAYHHGWQQLHDQAQRRLAFLASDLTTTLEKYENLPIALASHSELPDLLLHPDDAARRDTVNRRLERLAQATHVFAIYLIAADGQTLAASNWRTPTSFVGQNYAFRPYFRDALAGGTGRFYAIGATTKEPGYFLAQPVRDEDGRPFGVLAVKISFDDLEANWQRSGELLMLADARGVVFLSSRPEWRFHTLRPLDAGTQALLQATQQYGVQALAPLPLDRPDEAFEGRATRLATQAESGRAPHWLRVAAQRRTLGPMDWTLLSFAETDGLLQDARAQALAAGLAYAVVVVGLLYARLRRRRDEELRLVRRDLERANAELDARIDERTAHLREANEELAHKIVQLDRTQSTLRAAQDELVQAGKLAVLGQMAASITHEINQPLAALRALNDNAGMLLARGDLAAVQANIGRIGGLTLRIAEIVGRLKGFARKDELQPMPVAVAPAVEAACALVAADAQRAGMTLDVAPIAPELAMLGQTVRIEQVLVNLLRNALDANRDHGGHHVWISARHEGDRVRLAVADEGPGLSPAARQRLFEPFFTTKSAGQGLGLGLAISASIANALGGSIDFQDRPGGGTVATLTLPAAVLAAPVQALSTIG